MKTNHDGNPEYDRITGRPADDPLPIICLSCGCEMDEETDDGLCEPCNALAIREENERTENRSEDYFEMAKTITREHAGQIKGN